MTLQEIIDLSRQRLFDTKGIDSKRKWPDWELVAYANDAERALARCALEPLKDSDTIGYLTLSGTTGQVTSVSVSSVVITSGAVTFSTNLANTAANLAANINAFTSAPRYRAVARGSLVIIKATAQTGYPVGGYSLAAAVVSMAAAVTNLPGLCRHVVAIGQRILTLDSRVIRIKRFKPSSQTQPIALYTKGDMDATLPGWEAQTSAAISLAIPDYEGSEITLVPASNTVELIEQDVVRLPLIDFVSTNMTAMPEVPVRYHETLIEWIMRVAYRKNDVETLDLARSQTHEAEFNRRIEEFRVQDIRKSPDNKVNRPPLGML